MYRIDIASEPDYSDVYAEIYHGDELVAIVSQERGSDPSSLDIELNVAGTATRAVHPLSEFLAAIDRAKARLTERSRLTDYAPREDGE